MIFGIVGLAKKLISQLFITRKQRNKVLGQNKISELELRANKTY